MAFTFGVESTAPHYKIKSKVRLIELFAGVGTQAMAMRDIGADFERYRVVEFDKYAINSYNSIHGTNFEPTDIRNLHSEDLGIVDKDKYEYLVFYSFPCTDLSLSGKRQGMSKGSGTRSGLLWEVERLLDESVERANKEGINKDTYLPQLLIMENVPQVHSPKNKDDWDAWLNKLKSLGYTSVYKDLNSRDFNVPQNRLRCFMVSMLGDFTYDFPTPPGLTKKLEDVLETDVERRFYVSEERKNQLLNDLKDRGII